MISTKFKYFFDGFGQYVVFTTKKQCKEYLKVNPNINRIKDLKEIGIEEWNKISEHPRDQVFEVIDNVAVPMEIINVKDEPISEQIQYEDCPNCADQASIAAPGQTTLCKTHDDEKHFREMKEFFIEECERLIFKPALPMCSCCGTEKTVVYVGIIISVTGHPLTFSFCIDCRDELTLKQNAARAALERIGA